MWKPQQLGANKYSTLVLITLCLAVASGCMAKPDSVVTIKSPSDSVFYTKETSYGHGAVSNDFTRVYGHYQNGKQIDKQLVVDGAYIEDVTIRWTSPEDVDICLAKGITNTFRNQVTLETGETSSITIHNHLKEHC